MIGDLFADHDSALQASAALGGIAASLASLEWLALRHEFTSRGCFAWKLVGSRRFLLRHLRVRSLLGPLLDYPAIVGVLALRAVGGLALTAAALAGAPLTAPLAIVAFCSLLLAYRHVYSQDGSDQMTTIVVVGLGLGLLLGAEQAAVVFVGVQGVLAYAVSGAAKARGRLWRNGEAMPKILATRSYGSPALGAVLHDHRWMGRSLTWSILGLECLFPLALLAPQEILVGLLVGVAFVHLGSAAVMGINVFPWAFLASYPCIIYLAQQL